jgi:hypothetical protein
MTGLPPTGLSPCTIGKPVQTRTPMPIFYSFDNYSKINKMAKVDKISDCQTKN